jgi:hypothetical protein
VADPVAAGRWLRALGMLAASTVGKAEADERIAAYIPLLADRYGDACFCAASLSYVAERCEYFPPYAVLCGHLSQWWREQPHEDLLALPAPARDREAEQREEDAQAAREWGDAAKIEDMVRMLEGQPWRPYLGRMIGTAVMRHAPQHAGLLPAEFLAPTPEADRRRRLRDAAD